MTGSDRQLSCLAQVCSFILLLEQLRLCEKKYSQLQAQDDVENGRWLELLHPRTAVKHLWLYFEFGASPASSKSLSAKVGQKCYPQCGFSRNGRQEAVINL